MHSRISRGVLIIALLALLTALLAPGFSALAQEKTPAPIPPALVAANNAFGFRLYAELAKTDGQKNLYHLAAEP